VVDGIARWEAAASRLHWAKPWSRVHDPKTGRWFIDGELNLAVNLVHRHLEHRANATALLWEGEPGDRRTITYGQLQREVVDLAAAFAGLGVTVGDRVALYAGLIPETVVAMLACAHLGAAWSVLPAVLPEEALFERLADLDPTVLITQDGAWRHGVVLPLKARADEVLAARGGIEHTVVIRRAGIDVAWYEGDRWYHELVAAPRSGPGAKAAQLPPAAAAADNPAMITYVANRRGRPAGVVHPTAGLLVHCHEVHTGALGLSPQDVVWTATELGWIAGPTQGVIGPLSAGGTAVAYEGMLDTPTHGRVWDVVQRYRVHTLLITPSVARSLRRWDDVRATDDQVSSLRTIVTAGEAIDDETLAWLARDVGRDHVEVTNGWGQTELGGFAYFQPPLLGRRGLPDGGLAVVNAQGDRVAVGEEGDLVLTEPWPAASTAILNENGPRPGVDPDRPGLFVTGDRARQQVDGSIQFLGRSDRVINVSGQLVSAQEIRLALEEHPLVARAEVVDRPDPRTGRAVVATVAPVPGAVPSHELATDLRLQVHELLGGLAQPKTVAFIDTFPDELSDAELVRALQALCDAATPLIHLTCSRVRSVGAILHEPG
jgi:acetyl-CoA synthetase